jgi:hypothetical protein
MSIRQCRHGVFTSSCPWACPCPWASPAIALTEIRVEGRKEIAEGRIKELWEDAAEIDPRETLQARRTKRFIAI